MSVANIYIYGEIGYGFQDSIASEYGYVTVKDVVKQLGSVGEAEEIIVHIHSNGGGVDEGFAIHDILRATGKKITTINEGMCASIATIILLAGDTRIATENSTTLIHFPTAGI